MPADRHSIITLPNHHLRQRSQKVGIVSPQILQLVDDMKAATLDWEDSREHEVGVALAAIQIDQPIRVVIVREDFDDKDNRNFIICINPVITKYEGELVEDYEGCLSIQDIYGKVPRYEKVRIKALDLNGREFRVTATGFLARVFQHEIDHTNGIVFIDHIQDDPKAFYQLDKKGHLQALDYTTEIKDNPDLWETTESN